MNKIYPEMRISVNCNTNAIWLKYLMLPEKIIPLLYTKIIINITQNKKFKYVLRK